jgi:hypothetical protein
MDILSDMYSAFRIDWVAQFPGSNENDVERHFLYSVYQGLNDTHMVPTDISDKIEKIR